MKKLILFLLIGALLVLPLSGCFADNQQNEVTTPNNTTENTTPEVTTPPENDQNDPPVVEGELDKDSELIVELIAYLEQYLVEYDLISVSFSAKINQIKNGAQPLHVAFDPNNYYFVGGYYNNAHKDSVIDYRYASEYVWVGYKSEAEIQEYYNGMPCVVVFQINRALTVTNILSDEPANDMEHFQIYKPTFENGANTASPIAFDDTFIYLNNVSNRFDEDIIYHSKSWYYHGNATISCICLDGEYYLPFYLATLEDGEIFDAQQALSTNQITYTLGEYYDAIINIMNTEKYNVEVNEKYTYRYGVVSIDDFVNLMTPDNPPEVTTPPDNSQGNNVPNNDDTSYVIVGTNASDEAMSQYALSAKIPAEWRITNGDILISLSFGLIKGCEVTDSTYSHILFWFENSAEQFFTFKKISIEEINKAEYIVEPIWDENREWAIGYTYTHIEDVILPLSMFSENSGIVWICMSELADGDISFESLGSGAYVALHYKKDGEKIIISAIASSN